jgi:hypothetical protein
MNFNSMFGKLLLITRMFQHSNLFWIYQHSSVYKLEGTWRVYISASELRVFTVLLLNYYVLCCYRIIMHSVYSAHRISIQISSKFNLWSISTSVANFHSNTFDSFWVVESKHVHRDTDMYTHTYTNAMKT